MSGIKFLSGEVLTFLDPWTLTLSAMRENNKREEEEEEKNHLMMHLGRGKGIFDLISVQTAVHVMRGQNSGEKFPFFKCRHRSLVLRSTCKGQTHFSISPMERFCPLC